MLCKTITLAAAALSLITAGPVFAHDFSDTAKAQTTIEYSDLDLTKAPGASAILARINSAARKLCRPALQNEYDGFRAYRICVGEAVDRAVAELNSPLVASLHNSNSRPVAQSN